MGGAQKRLWSRGKVLFLELDVAHADVHFVRILQLTHVCILGSYECIIFYYKMGEADRATRMVQTTAGRVRVCPTSGVCERVKTRPQKQTSSSSYSLNKIVTTSHTNRSINRDGITKRQHKNFHVTTPLFT